MNFNLDNITILLVEESQNDREILVNILSKYFKNIFQAENGKVAFEIFKKNRDIDIIISDVDMQILNGIDFLKSVRQLDLYIPFIVTATKIESSVLMEAINLNVSSFLLKPIDLGKLLERVDILCEKKLIQYKLNEKQKEIENYIEAVDKVSLIFKMTKDGNITYMNESMRLVCKYKNDEVKKLNFNDIIHPNIPKKYIDETWEKVKNGELWNGNTKFISKDNEVFYLNNTIFKIEKLSKEEYITIAFLNTKENLEKRDFHKKVLLSIKEANKKEYELKKHINSLNQKLKIYEKKIDGLISVSNKLQQKVNSKNSQILHLEKEILKLNSKYDDMLKNKRQEVELNINTLQKYKIDFEKQKEEILKKEEELSISHKKVVKLLDDILEKDKTIKDLRFIINEMDNK